MLASELLMTYGYWAVLLLVAVESMGLPVPGEMMVLTAAIYAGATHQLDITLVVVAAAAGAILGDNLGYLLGREGGYRLLRRYGRYIRLAYAGHDPAQPSTVDRGDQVDGGARLARRDLGTARRMALHGPQPHEDGDVAWLRAIPR
jgi:membrane protein DedA with SNARE-associated domain